MENILDQDYKINKLFLSLRNFKKSLGGSSAEVEKGGRKMRRFRG